VRFHLPHQPSLTCVVPLVIFLFRCGSLSGAIPPCCVASDRWIRPDSFSVALEQRKSCVLYLHRFGLSGVMDLFNSVNDCVKGGYMWIM
jgi:hypothetical protein